MLLVYTSRGAHEEDADHLVQPDQGNGEVPPPRRRRRRRTRGLLVDELAEEIQQRGGRSGRARSSGGVSGAVNERGSCPGRASRTAHCS